ncbi:MAG: GGDEF domain-containing protein [Alphaproteobacteria bacterium]|nr:GGDEF domain-containing protein [Alphaproteobacteria bacterium]
MPPAKVRPDKSVHIGDAIVADMRAAHLSFEPRQFEFWFAYTSGRNTALNAAANDIKNRNGALSAADVEHLHATFLSPWRLAAEPDDVAARMATKLVDLSAALEHALGTAKAQRETLAAETAELTITSALTLHDVLSAIDRLTHVTRECQSRFELLEARVDAVGREIGALRQQLATVQADCATDPTTALPGRAAFDAALAKALAAAAETRQPLAVLLCDLDYFAAFNENFGNFTGDQVLRSVGLLLRSHLRPSDLTARFASDQFAVVLPQTRGTAAVALADRFRQVLMAHELIPHPNGAGRLTASIGVADAIKGDTPEFLLRRAQNGLTVAKREGRNRVVEMTPDGPIWEMERRA